MKPKPIPDNEYITINDQFVEENKEQVVKMAQLGCTSKEIAHILNVKLERLNYHFDKHLQDGRSNLRRALRKAQLESAINDRNTTMLIWLGKNYLGQKEPKHDVQHNVGITIEKVVFGLENKADDSKIIEIEG